MYSGRQRTLLRSAQPSIWPRSVIGAACPGCGPGGSQCPVSRLLATPSAGRPLATPKCAAMPSRRGWAMPWPSTIARSGVRDSMASARSRAGSSRKLSRPGTYGIVVGRRARCDSSGCRVCASTSTTAARVVAPWSSKPTSKPAMVRNGVASWSCSDTCAASCACSTRAPALLPSQPGKGSMRETCHCMRPSWTLAAWPG